MDNNFKKSQEALIFLGNRRQNSLESKKISPNYILNLN